jgi:hypothetical protein
MPSYPEFIAKAGACLVTKNVLTHAGSVRWMVREDSKAPVDNGWRIFSEVDTEEYLADASNFQITDFNAVCALEPALIGIYDFPVGSDLEILRDDAGIHIIDATTGREVPRDRFYVPPQFRARPE